MTIAERIATISAVSGVRGATTKGEVEDIGGGQHRAIVRWIVGSGDIARVGGAVLLVSGYNTEQEQAQWADGLPSILAPAPAGTRYITGRNTPFTAAQVEAFANAQWRAQGAAYTSAPDILGFEVDNLDGKSVKISGLFWMEDGTRSDRAYVIRLVDANGLTTAASGNVKFERIL